MKPFIGAALGLLLTISPGQAQQTEGTASSPIVGVDDASVARSARASKIIGSKVYQGDTSIGSIEDVLVDLDRGTAPAVVLSVGGFLGVGEKLVAIPVGQIKVGSEAKFTTDLTKDQLKNAPAFVFGKK